jgi:hypothetical protein
MKPIKSGLALALICAMMSIVAVGQNKGDDKSECNQENGAVARKDDRFTGEATVTLKPQSILNPAIGQQLKMALEYKTKPARPGRVQSFVPEMINVTFTSSAAETIYGGELELVFLIDGERVRRAPGTVHNDYSRLSSEKLLTQTVFTSMSVDTLRRIARGKKIEMKLGATEVEFDEGLLKALRSFAACAPRAD